MTQNFPEDLNRDPQDAADPYYVPPASRQVSPAEERTWGMLAHVIALAAMVLSAGLLGFVAALVIYLYFKDKGPFVRQHAANSLNVQLTMAIVIVISLPLMLLLVGFLTYGLAFLFAAVVHIMGALKAGNGEWFKPPFTIRFVR